MAENVFVEVFHQSSNFVVLRVPGRRFPGVLIQGDSLGGIVGELSAALEYFETDRNESRDCLLSVYESLKSRLDDYNDICQSNGIK